MRSALSTPVGQRPWSHRWLSSLGLSSADRVDMEAISKGMERCRSHGELRASGRAIARRAALQAVFERPCHGADATQVLAAVRCWRRYTLLAICDVMPAGLSASSSPSNRVRCSSPLGAGVRCDPAGHRDSRSGVRSALEKLALHQSQCALQRSIVRVTWCTLVNAWRDSVRIHGNARRGWAILSCIRHANTAALRQAIKWWGYKWGLAADEYLASLKLRRSLIQWNRVAGKQRNISNNSSLIFYIVFRIFSR